MSSVASPSSILEIISTIFDDDDDDDDSDNTSEMEDDDDAEVPSNTSRQAAGAGNAKKVPTAVAQVGRAKQEGEHGDHVAGDVGEWIKSVASLEWITGVVATGADKDGDQADGASNVATSIPDSEKHEFQESLPAQEKASGRSMRMVLWMCLCLCLVTVGIPLGATIYYWQDEDKAMGLARCGDCHCSYANGEQFDSCPERPPTDFSPEFLESLLALEPAYELPTLDCDPYQDGECQTRFPRFDDDSQAVCAIHLMPVSTTTTTAGSRSDDSSCGSYWMVSYANADEAVAAGAHVTHRGTCGLCSSLQDLVVYMRYTDLTTLGQECGVKGLAARDNGVECFQEKLGMTQGCAEIWMANVRSTLHNCGGICFKEDFLDVAFNGPAPMCQLSECLQCDEDNSGDVFKAFAGRTRRRSGLISAIARPCDTIASEIRHDLPTNCLSW